MPAGVGVGLRGVSGWERVLMTATEATADTGRTGPVQRSVEIAVAVRRSYVETAVKDDTSGWTRVLPTVEQVLGCPVRPNPLGAQTVGEYLREALVVLWKTGTFPLDSGEIEAGLIRAKVVDGRLVDDLYLDGYDQEFMDALVTEAVHVAFSGIGFGRS